MVTGCCQRRRRRRVVPVAADWLLVTQGALQMMEGLNGMARYLNSAAQTMQDTDGQPASAIRGQ